MLTTEGHARAPVSPMGGHHQGRRQLDDRPEASGIGHSFCSSLASSSMIPDLIGKGVEEAITAQ